jgi:hypothetical protein
VGVREFPEEGSQLEFQRVETLHEMPVVLFLDLETTHTPVNEVR